MLDRTAGPSPAEGLFSVCLSLDKMLPKQIKDKRIQIHAYLELY